MSVPPEEPNCARCAAAARLRTAPPVPTSRPPWPASQSARASSRRDVIAQPLQVLLACRAVGVSVGEERFGHAHGADRERDEVALVAVLDLDQLHAAAADVEHDAVGERGAVDRRHVAVMRLLARSRAPRPRSRSPPAPARRNGSRLLASRIALVAKTWTSSSARRFARQKRSKIASVSRPRSIAASLSAPVAAMPLPIRTDS